MRTKGALKREYQNLEKEIYNYLTKTPKSTNQIYLDFKEKYTKISHETVKDKLLILTELGKVRLTKLKNSYIWQK